MLFEYRVDDCVGSREGRSVYPEVVSYTHDARFLSNLPMILTSL
jgi:hypothetical protein